MQILNLEQGSTQWLALRKTVITGTDGAMVINKKSWPRLKQSKVTPSTFKSAGMMRGIELEHQANAALERETGLKYRPAIVFYKEERMLASLDGLAFGKVATNEIKCPEKGNRSDLWKQAEQGKIPHAYYLQAQVGLIVSGAAVCHYWVYDADLDKGIRVDVKPDFTLHCKIVESVRAYWVWDAEQEGCQEEKITAKIGQDAIFEDIENYYLQVLATKARIDTQLKAVEEQLLSYQVPGVEITEGTTVLIEEREATGSIDYKTALTKYAPNIDLELFRKTPKKPYTVSIKLTSEAKKTLKVLTEKLNG